MAGFVTVAVLGAGAVVADRVAADRAEQEVSDAIVANLEDVQGEPQVDVPGFPFLPQLLRGSIEDLDARVDGATVGGIAMTDVRVAARETSTSAPHAMGEAVLTATVPTASLEQTIAERAGAAVTVTVDGNRLAMSGDVFGLALAAGLVPRVEEGRLLVDVDRLTLDGVQVDVSALPEQTGDRLTDLEVPIEGLPDGLTLTGAEVVADGLRVTAAGTDVVLPTDAP